MSRDRLVLIAGRTLSVLPVAIIAAVIILALVTPSNIHVAPLLAVAPAAAGLTGGRARDPWIIGAVACACSLGLAVDDRTVRDGEPGITLISVALVSAASSAGVYVRNRQQRTLEDVRSVAEAAQGVLLRPVPRRVGPLAAAVRYKAAAAHARIGGDLYDVVLTRFGVRALVGDVRGKGLEAVQTAAAVLNAFREAAYEEEALPGVVRRVAESMRRRLDENAEEFVTLVLVSVRDDGTLQIVNCGHPPPLLLRRAAAEELLGPSQAPPLGVVDMTDVEIPVLGMPLERGDRVLMYTDGIIEARNSKGTFYPLLDRAPDALPGVEHTLDRIEADVHAHVGHPLQDDAAMLLLQYEPDRLRTPREGDHVSGLTHTDAVTGRRRG